MSGRVLVVGDVMTDVIVMPEGPLVRGSDRRAIVRSRPGGSGANQAVWLGAMKANVHFAARVGVNDRKELDAHFRALGVLPVLAADEHLPSGVLVTIVDPDGERSFLTDRGANANLCTQDLPQSLLEDTALVIVSGYSLFSPGPREAVRALLAVAKTRGVAVAVDPASVGFLLEVGAANFLEWTAGADWIFANDAEAETLTGETTPEQQVAVLSRFFGHVVLKRGSLGALVADASGIRVSHPAKEVPVIDTTGAGDAFAAGFIAAHLRGESLDASLQAGIASGAQAVQAIGGQPTQDA